MIDIDGWTALSFHFKINGLEFTKSPGTTDYEIDNCGYEFYPDTNRDDPQVVLILLHLATLSDRENAPDINIAIAEDAFRAGWTGALTYAAAEGWARDSKLEGAYVSGENEAWSAYTPPEELTGGGVA